LLPEFGYVYGAEFSVGEAPRVSVSYTAEWTGYEIHSHGLMQALRPRAPQVPLDELLSDMQAGELDPIAKAWLIYDWMLTCGRFEKSWNPCLCLSCCARDFARDRVGHCIVLAHAFIAYCHRVGVPARPVRGAMFTHPRDTSGRRFGVAAEGEPVIGHSWAEFEAPGLGWLPVEFHAIVFRSTSERNCYDETLRQTLDGDFDFLRDFYFGGLDNQRMVCSRSSIQIMPVRYYDGLQPEGARWRPVPMQRLRDDLEIEYV